LQFWGRNWVLQLGGGNWVLQFGGGYGKVVIKFNDIKGSIDYEV
jgi:hypothetical protein